MKQEDNDKLNLRIYIYGGGCSGFQYGFEFDEAVNEDDLVIEKSGVKLLVDHMSLQYLEGSVVDFQDDLLGSRFTVNNPNAKGTCGCGESFTVKE